MEISDVVQNSIRTDIATERQWLLGNHGKSRCSFADENDVGHRKGGDFRQEEIGSELVQTQYRRSAETLNPSRVGAETQDQHRMDVAATGALLEK